MGDSHAATRYAKRVAGDRRLFGLWGAIAGLAAVIAAIAAFANNALSVVEKLGVPVGLQPESADRNGAGETTASSPASPASSSRGADTPSREYVAAQLKAELPETFFVDNVGASTHVAARGSFAFRDRYLNEDFLHGINKMCRVLAQARDLQVDVLLYPGDNPDASFPQERLNATFDALVAAGVSRDRITSMTVPGFRAGQHDAQGWIEFRVTVAE